MMSDMDWAEQEIRRLAKQAKESDERARSLMMEVEKLAALLRVEYAKNTRLREESMGLRREVGQLRRAQREQKDGTSGKTE